ncbi:MAG: hypothetical protein KGK08_06770 [Acidobacteriota bacterium]|nr:hypothetical protein [Acidobacteriota bacterium]
MSTKLVQEFLSRCFNPEETLALLLLRESPRAMQQRIVTLQQLRMPRYLAWLAYENAKGANIYVSANPLLSGSRRRTKDSIEQVRHLYLDLDTDGEARLAALRASQHVPTPSVILQTSPAKYQVLWRVAGFDFDQQEATLKVLAQAFGGDPACTDRNRVLRLPGFRNCKYALAHVVTAEYPSTTIYSPQDFRLSGIESLSTAASLRPTSAKPKGPRTPSEEDWAWTFERLRLGVDARQLTHELSLRRPDKPNPTYYAARTVDLASARLALRAGAALDEVIAQLYQRRLQELAPQRCASRAREIAATAQRMLAHPESTTHLPTQENPDATA